MKPLYRFGYLLAWLVGKILFRFRVIHRERIIEEGGAILAMNHQSYLDPPMAGISCRKEVYFLARKTLLDWPVVGPLFPRLNVIPVDQDRADMSALKALIRLVKEGKRTIIFPEGNRSWDGALQPAQPGLGLVVAKTRVPVVPMRIFGACEALPRGAKGIRLRPVTIVVGEPLHFTDADFEGDARTAYQRVSDRVMEAIAALTLDS